MPRLGPAGAGLFAALHAVGGRRLGVCARRLGRALKLQHQLDQFVFAQPFEVGPSHDDMESADQTQRSDRCSWSTNAGTASTPG